MKVLSDKEILLLTDKKLMDSITDDIVILYNHFFEFDLTILDVDRLDDESYMFMIDELREISYSSYKNDMENLMFLYTYFFSETIQSVTNHLPPRFRMVSLSERAMEEFLFYHGVLTEI